MAPGAPLRHQAGRDVPLSHEPRNAVCLGRRQGRGSCAHTSALQTLKQQTGRVRAPV
jgi:hypothetical protein